MKQLCLVSTNNCTARFIAIEPYFLISLKRHFPELLLRDFTFNVSNFLEANLVKLGSTKNQGSAITITPKCVWKVFARR